MDEEQINYNASLDDRIMMLMQGKRKVRRATKTSVISDIGTWTNCIRKHYSVTCVEQFSSFSRVLVVAPESALYVVTESDIGITSLQLSICVLWYGPFPTRHKHCQWDQMCTDRYKAASGKQYSRFFFSQKPWIVCAMMNKASHVNQAMFHITFYINVYKERIKSYKHETSNIKQHTASCKVRMFSISFINVNFVLWHTQICEMVYFYQYVILFLNMHRQTQLLCK